MSLFGFLNSNKPTGMTSRDVVNRVQRRLRHLVSDQGGRSPAAGKLKVGHAGTLDPLAEGVLVIAVGAASRLVPYVQQQPKHYRAVFRLGESTDSGDLEGQVTRHPELAPPSAAALAAAATSLVGEIEQTPPAHSAVWVDGQRAYKRVRAGETVQMPSRRVVIHEMTLLRYDYPEVEFEVRCGSGTYIRSLGIDLAVAAGSVAVMSHLVRLGVGPFSIDSALSIDQLTNGDLAALMLPPELAVEHMPKLTISDRESERLGHGLAIAADAVQPNPTGVAAAMTTAGRLRAIVLRANDHWHPHRVFPTL